MRPNAKAESPSRWDPSLHGDLIAWRHRQLLRSGFAAELAVRVAADRSHDIHALLELVDRGCPPDLAVRITAPL
jgi:hypothetical protein